MTGDQALEALAYANRIRTARAAVKKGIAGGKFNPLEVLQEPTELLEGMTVRELLLSVPKLGPVRVDRVLAYCRISPTKTLKHLTERQIWELDEKLSSLDAWCSALART